LFEQIASYQAKLNQTEQDEPSASWQIKHLHHNYRHRYRQHEPPRLPLILFEQINTQTHFPQHEHSTFFSKRQAHQHFFLNNIRIAKTLIATATDPPCSLTSVVVARRAAGAVIVVITMVSGMVVVVVVAGECGRRCCRLWSVGVYY